MARGRKTGIPSDEKPKLGINGLGRIGKLTLWYHIGRKYFSEIVVNIGRQVGTRLEDIAFYIEKDSTYGSLHHHLYGYKAKRLIETLDEKRGTMVIDGVPVTILRETRVPKDIGWDNYGVRLVVEATGKFVDPTAPADHKGGSVRGHLMAGAQKIMVSAPLKIKTEGLPMPEDAVTTVLGINDDIFDPAKHTIISTASCTTTCLAYMMKPLIDYFGPEKILTASMDTVHGTTGSQQVLDRLPKTGATDLRKNRSILNNIILTTTGAAKALALVIPEMRKIGFIAESVRVPVTTGSLIILIVNLHDEPDKPTDRETINKIYQEAAKRDKRGYLQYTDEQNVSSDIIGTPIAAATIEGHETHTRTAYVTLDLARVCRIPGEPLTPPPQSSVEIPITQIVIYGWYDNELGSYTHMMGDMTAKVASTVY